MSQIFTGRELERLVIHPLQVRKALKNAKRGKASGPDHLTTENFLLADGKIYFYWALLYFGMLTLGYLPYNFMKSVIVPIIKNKIGNTSNKGNYRLVAIVPAASKLFEIVLLDIIDE